MKNLKIFFLTLIILLSSGLFLLSKNPLSISSDFLQKIAQKYNPNLSIVSDDATLIFKDFKLQIISPKLELKNASSHLATFEELIISFSIFTLQGKLSAKITDSKLLNLIYLKNNHEIQAMIDEYNNQHNIPLTGDLAADFSVFGINKAEMNLVGKSGWHQSTKENLKPINLNDLVLSITYHNDILSVNKFQISYDNNISASLNGDFAFSGDELSSAKFQTDIANLPIKYLEGLWPKILFPEIHQWVNTHISDGIIKKAHGDFNLTEEDFKESNPVAKKAINAEIEISNAKLKYLDKYSPITNINGIVKFDGEALYLNADKASMLGGQVTKLSLSLPFSSFILSLKANIAGEIANFQEFIPEIVQTKLKNYSLSYKEIKGSASGAIDLTLPISDNFDIKKLQLYIKAQLHNVILDKLGVFELKTGDIELTNEEDKINLKINKQNLKAFDLTHHHDQINKQHNQMNIDAEIDINKPINLPALKLNQGKFKLTGNLTEELWKLSLDLSNTEVFINKLGYNKAINQKSIIECSGQVEQLQLASDNCNLNGQELAGKIDFLYSYEDQQLKKFNLKQAKLGANNFSLQVIADKYFSNYNLSAKNLDLSNSSFELAEDNNSSYKITFKIDQALLKNQTSLSNLNGEIKAIKNHPPEISMHAFSGSDKITLSRAKKNEQDIYSFYSSSAAVFFKAFGIYNNIKKGEIWFDIYPETTPEGINYHGKMKVTNFSLTNTSILSKIILGILSPLNSPQAMAQAFQGGSLKADYFTTNLDYKKGILNLKDGLMEGSSYKIRLSGYFDLPNRNLQFKGLYIPSFYGINTFVSMIPLLGKLLIGGDKSAFIAANFGFKGSFEKPVTSFNPMSIFTPGFLRKIFN